MCGFLLAEARAVLSECPAAGSRPSVSVCSGSGEGLTPRYSTRFFEKAFAANKKERQTNKNFRFIIFNGLQPQFSNRISISCGNIPHKPQISNRMSVNFNLLLRLKRPGNLKFYKITISSATGERVSKKELNTPAT